jgi:signal transduction histidine kinase
MSHELRTPLHGVLGFTQTLSQDPDLTPKQKSHVQVIQRSGEHLLTLLSDILDLSRIEVHKMELQPTEFYFKLFLDKVFDMCRFRAADKGLVPHLETTSVLPTTIFADEKRLRQTLINLLGNAVKFTKQGYITFRVGILPDTLKTKYVADNYSTIIRFEVEDSGIGINPEQLKKIFLPFEQVVGGRDQADGAGLGLTISQRFVGIMGGELQVKSEVGRGSTFWFDLPLAVTFLNQPVGVTSTEETVPLEPTTAPADPMTEKIIPPSPEILTLLLSLIEIGDFDNLEAQVTQLCQDEAQLKPFGQQLLELAGQFEEEKMIALLEEYRGASA